MSNTERLESSSPQDPGRILATFADMDRDEVASIVEAAALAQRQWASAAPSERANALASAASRLEKAAGELTELGIWEVGKPRSEMAGEVARGVSILRYYAEEVFSPDGTTLPAADPRGLLLARRRPRGVIACITPWNFPVAIPLWKLAPALAYGNAAVLKPAPAATALAHRLVEILREDLPAGLLGLATGNAKPAQALIDLADAVTFTGSVRVGREIAARCGALAKPCQAEMGGQNPAIVLPDAELRAAAKTIAWSAMGYAGQKCTATSRVVVVGDGDQFLEALKTSVAELAVGDPADAGVVVGPVISEAARNRVLEAVARATQEGGRVILGGGVLDQSGWFVQPTLVEGVAADSIVAQEEVFGPFVTIHRARDDQEALEVANGVNYGLVSAVFTSDLDRALWFAERLEAGMVRVNAPTAGVDFWAPFGGIKDSSYGPREQGKAAREFFTWIQTTTISPARR